MANIVQLIGFVSLFTVGKPLCLDGWARRQDSCYYFENLVKKTWLEASFICQSKNADLVRIESKEENDFIKHEVTKLQHGSADEFWTAGNDIFQEGHWVWGHSSDSITLNLWAPGEPNHDHGEEDCMTIDQYLSLGWNDQHCERPEFFICEIEDPVIEIVG